METTPPYRAIVGILGIGVVLTVFVSAVTGVIGFGIGRNGFAALPMGSTAVVRPSPAAGVELPGPDLDFLGSVDAVRTIRPRIEEHTAFTGRFKHLSIGADHTLVALVEVEGHGVDSVVFSWGQTLRKPVPMDAADAAQLEGQLFSVSDAQLAAIPSHVARILQEHPHGTSVDRVNLHALLGRPMMEVTLLHDRTVFEPVRTDLDGQPLSPR